MIGDNPAADVRGANRAGDPWRSILVCTGQQKRLSFSCCVSTLGSPRRGTGVYQGGVGSNDKEVPLLGEETFVAFTHFEMVALFASF